MKNASTNKTIRLSISNETHARLEAAMKSQSAFLSTSRLARACIGIGLAELEQAAGAPDLGKVVPFVTDLATPRLIGAPIA